METKVFSAYNEGSKRVISPRLTVVDAAREPLKVLKILMEGLAADSRSGIWLINFQGVPVARSRSAFDLVYLDDAYQVVHAIEISERSEFKPFKGDPTSALILAPASLSRSKTFTGDRITIAPAEQRTVDPQSIPTAKRTPHFPARIVGAFGAKTFNVPQETVQAAQAATAVSGRLMRSGSLALDHSPQLRPVATPAVAQLPDVNEEPRENKVVPISTVRVSASEIERSVTPELPKRPVVPPATVLASPPPASALFEKERPVARERQEASMNTASIAPAATGSTPQIDTEPVTQMPLGAAPNVSPAIPEVKPPESERTLPAHSFPSTGVLTYSEEQSSSLPETLGDDDAIAPQAVPSSGSDNEDAGSSEVRDSSTQVELGRKALASLKRRWDVRLLYMLFPELDPSYRPEFQAPVVDFHKDVFESTATPKLSRKIQILSWFYPDLQLDTVHMRQREHRRAPRISQPGLVGYYFSGGKADPHEIRNLSVMGFYMVTEERWLPGTVIRVTLQMRDGVAEDPADSVTVLSRSVNWDERGGGFEFVLPGFID